MTAKSQADGASLMKKSGAPFAGSAPLIRHTG